MDKDINKNKLKKSYKLLVVWFLSLLIFAIIYGELVLWADLDLSLKKSALLSLNLTSIFIVSLFVMIYKTERVYYINYITYTEALESTKEERRNFAYKHLRLFCIATITFIFYTIISLGFQFLMFVDIGVYLLTFIITAIKTVPYKLKEK